MAIAWQDRFTPLANVNNGNELENGDTATGEHITIALENGAYAKKKTDENASEISSVKNRTTNLEGRTSILETKVTTLEGKHLYRHDVTINGTFTFNNKECYFNIHLTLYTPSSSSIGQINDIGTYISYMGTEVNANGYAYTTYVGSQFYSPIVNVVIRPSGQVLISFSFIYYGGVVPTLETFYFDNSATFVDRVTQIL